ncbi:amino-terminal enhancer of split isoform X1 [Enhydra lutris kenyoni]|uniref:Amino-terminal enhancer of split isoform X1 n=1 Tax=Enhydra lutris kenyoni TaxID=391180 RepID=A0A2Y9L4J5_ENHLU|nr:amino-terminal enhancer of split isoform X1 [Enhydra lutris kenyoni]
MMFPQSRHSGSSHLPQQLKFTTSDSCDRIKDEFQLLQAQYHSLKLECDKLASEKSEMQRHYVMYYEMSYGLNIEMHKQAEIVKRLNGICAQVLPYLSQEHQQQVLGAIERAKQVTAPELNSIIRPEWANARSFHTGGQLRPGGTNGRPGQKTAKPQEAQHPCTAPFRERAPDRRAARPLRAHAPQPPTLALHANTTASCPFPHPTPLPTHSPPPLVPEPTPTCPLPERGRRQ